MTNGCRVAVLCREPWPDVDSPVVRDATLDRFTSSSKILEPSFEPVFENSRSVEHQHHQNIQKVDSPSDASTAMVHPNTCPTESTVYETKDVNYHLPSLTDRASATSNCGVTTVTVIYSGHPPDTVQTDPSVPAPVGIVAAFPGMLQGRLGCVGVLAARCLDYMGVLAARVSWLHES